MRAMSGGRTEEELQTRPARRTAGSVPVVALLEGQRAAGRAVAVADVAEAPLDLGGGVRLPVRPGGGHLGAGQRLRDAVRGRGRVVGVDAPAALADPEAVEAAELVGGEPELRQEGPRDVAGVLARDVLVTGDRRALTGVDNSGVTLRDRALTLFPTQGHEKITSHLARRAT